MIQPELVERENVFAFQREEVQPEDIFMSEASAEKITPEDIQAVEKAVMEAEEEEEDPFEEMEKAAAKKVLSEATPEERMEDLVHMTRERRDQLEKNNIDYAPEEFTRFNKTESQFRRIPTKFLLKKETDTNIPKWQRILALQILGERLRKQKK